MKEYIDKSEAVERALHTPIMSYGPVREEDVDAWVDGSDVTAEQIAKSIAAIPAADVVERKRGEWKEADDGDGVVCSVCGEDFCAIYLETERFNFCPNCGADMREVDHEN